MSKLCDWMLAVAIATVFAGQVWAGDALALRPTMTEDIAYLQQEWARIKYQVPEDERKLEEYERLEAYAARVGAVFPDHAEPKIWEAIVLSSEAGVKRGLSALGKVKRARDLLEAALKIDGRALDGSAHTSLGSLYYQVPGWPLAFGDDDKAEQHLKAALAINPDGIDPNYFYGDFLLQQRRYDQARTVLEHALAASPRPGRELADAGRRQEIKAALAELRSKRPGG